MISRGTWMSMAGAATAALFFWAAPGAKTPAEWIYAHGRHLDTKGCSCSAFPLGGVDLERETLARWKVSAKALRISGGGTFAPMLSTRAPSRDVWRQRAEELADTLRALRTDAVALTAADLTAGIDDLRRWESASGATFVASDLVAKRSGQPLFTPFLPSTGDSRSWTLAAISSPEAAGVSLPSGVDRLDPETALRRVLAAMPKGSALVVVAPVTAEEANQLVVKFPEVVAWLGSPAVDEWMPLAKLESGTILATAADNGRGLVRLTVTGNDVVAEHRLAAPAPREEAQRLMARRPAR